MCARKMHRSSFADLWWSINGGFELTVVQNLNAVEILVRWWREEICNGEDYGEGAASSDGGRAAAAPSWQICVEEDGDKKWWMRLRFVKVRWWWI